jgi:hypothetical protein
MKKQNYYGLEEKINLQKMMVNIIQQLQKAHTTIEVNLHQWRNGT